MSELSTISSKKVGRVQVDKKREENAAKDDNVAKDEKSEKNLKESSCQGHVIDSEDSDFSDSPILFPSQEICEKQQEKEGDSSDCYMIIDVESDEKQNDGEMVKVAKKDSLNMSRRKRKPRGNGEESADVTKRRKIEEIDILTKSNISKRPCSLARVYRYPVCRTLAEAAANDLYYAPKHVDPSLYAAVIIRKLENYRRRLRVAQSRLTSFLPHSLGKTPAARSSTRGKRASVLKRNGDKGKRCAERTQNKQAEVVHVIDPFDELETEIKDEEKIDNAYTKLSARKTAKPSIETTKTAQKPPQKPAPNKTKQGNESSEESPMKRQVLSEKSRRVILEDDTSDEDAFDLKLPGLDPVSLSRQHVPEKPTRQQQSSLAARDKSTVAEQPSARQRQLSCEHPIVPKQPLSRDEEPEGFECPMCYKKFSKNKIEQHAANCDGLHEICSSPAKSTSEDNQRSPVIKVRTPEKLKELRLLQKAEERSRVKESVCKDNGKDGKIVEVEQSKKRIQMVEPSIRLHRLKTPSGKASIEKCGETKTTERQRETECTARKNLGKRLMEKDFIPLEKEEEIDGSDTDRLVQMLESVPPDDGLESKKAQKKVKSDKEYCYLCKNLIPRSILEKHVMEEIARNRQERAQTATDLSQDSKSQCDENEADEIQISSGSGRSSLPDLAVKMTNETKSRRKT